MNRFWAIVIKEFIEIRRDPRTLGLVLFMPAALLILYGSAITLDIREIPTAVCDRDRSPQSRGFIEMFTSSGYFTVLEPSACGRARPLLDQGKARVYLEIPPDFGQRRVSRDTAPLQILVDGADNNTASVSAGYVEEILRAYAEPEQTVEVRSRIWFNPELESSRFIIPGTIGILMMIIGVAIPSMALVRERERGNLEMLLSSPVRPLEIILGKMLPYALINLVVMVLILLTGMAVFHLPFLGNPFHLLCQTLVFLLAALGMGLLISTIAQTRPAAWFLSLLTTMLPSFILSGFIFPVESMPLPLQGISFLVPSTHFLVILRGILLKGVGAEAVWPHTLFLFGFASVVITISLRRFKTRVA